MAEEDIGTVLWLFVAFVSFWFFVVMTIPYAGGINLPLNL